MADKLTEQQPHEQHSSYGLQIYFAGVDFKFDVAAK